MKALKTALINIRRTPYQAFTAILMISITFFIAYSFSLMLIGADHILKFFETSPQVIAFFEINTEDEDIEDIANSTRDKSYVKEVKVVSKQEALDIYKSDNQENPLLLELVTADILPASLEVSATEVEYLSQIKEDLENKPDVEDVVLQQDIIDTLTNWTNSLRMVGITSTATIGITSFLIMIVIIGLKVANKKAHITIMKIIGATNSYIIAPFMFEGIIYGLTGATLGWIGMYVGLLYLTPWLKAFLAGIIDFPLSWELFAYQIGIGYFIGIFFGSFASLVAVKRLIKK